jgi:transcriptional regulator with XRE-family HTH domain
MSGEDLDPERTVAARIEAAREAMGLSMEGMARALGMTKSGYAGKVYGVGNSFRVNEVASVAAVYRKHTGRRLAAWPWVTDEEVRLLDGMLDALGR